MFAEELGGLGEVAPPDLAAFVARYRFFFHPIRYTSLGLAACEAMMLGMPVVALATTEMATVVQNGVSGWIDTDVDQLVKRMRELLADRAEASRLGEGAQRVARERFSIERFVAEWDRAFRDVTGSSVPRGKAELAS
jgi:glycosyltransferase involved in cell wall biosynthesis